MSPCRADVCRSLVTVSRVAALEVHSQRLRFLAVGRCVSHSTAAATFCWFCPFSPFPAASRPFRVPLTEEAESAQIKMEADDSLCFGVGQQIAFGKYDRNQTAKTSSYNLRPILWEAGLTVSNKVLECLVLRFAKNRVLTAESFFMALVRLHLAHGETCFD